MPTLPVFHGEPVASLWAIMRFPNDLEKADAFAAWHIAAGLGAIPDDPTIGREELRDIARGAARFAPWYQEVRQNEIAGGAVGAVVTALAALLVGDPGLASWNHAIEITSANAASAALGNAPIAISEPTLRGYMREFAAVLHLWGAWRIRGSHWCADAAVGYSALDDYQMFLCEAEAILEELLRWDGQKPEKSRSGYLKANFFQVDPDWRPPRRRPGWPLTGVVPAIALDLANARNIPTLKKSGRPPNPL